MSSIKEWVKKPIAYFLPVVILTGLYMIWSQVNFGTPMPVSGQIKQWWGTLTNAIYGSPIDSFDEIRRYLLGNKSPFLLLYSFIAPIVSWTKIADYAIGLISWVIIAGTMCTVNHKKETEVLISMVRLHGDTPIIYSFDIPDALFLHFRLCAHADLVLDCRNILCIFLNIDSCGHDLGKFLHFKDHSHNSWVCGWRGFAGYIIYIH